MKILVTGLCTLHWGRLQYGNVGNYYIIEPLFREIHRVFPQDEVLTTFQMTDEFIQKEKITTLPMEMYYSWREDELERARAEYEAVLKNGDYDSDYVKELKEIGLLINFSGDMWGDNAEHVGKDRFAVDLYKMRTAQLLGVKTILFAGTPGPFYDDKTRDFAKEVLKNFDLVVNREPTSSANLEKWNFDTSKVKDFACPAFLYVPEKREVVDKIIRDEHILEPSCKKTVGFTIGGFNLPVGPYDMWPREEWQYNVFADIIEHIVMKLGARVLLISHTNGFELPPNFKLINGRDYPILKQLQEIVLKRGNVKPEDVLCVENPHIPAITKGIVGTCDMMVTGRVHASVAAISQNVPTVFISYEKSFIPSTKMYGFASLVGLRDYVCEPADEEQIIKAVDRCWENLDEIRAQLEREIPKVQQKARDAFDEMKNVAK